jgi:hypothetical protein
MGEPLASSSATHRAARLPADAQKDRLAVSADMCACAPQLAQDRVASQAVDDALEQHDADVLPRVGHAVVMSAQATPRTYSVNSTRDASLLRRRSHNRATASASMGLCAREALWALLRAHRESGVQ